jgi:pimeloyl-ACP methyl ester carboxylesterase
MIEAELADIITHHTVELAGLRMHYVEAGAGPTIILLHGFPEMWWSWRHQIQPLAEAGFRVVVPDQRGYNDTDKQGPYDLDTLVGDVCRLVEALGAGATARIVGHDWGGAVAWHLAATRPEVCERLAVLNCPHPAMMRTGIFKPRQLMRSWYMFMFQVPGLAERILTANAGGGLVRVLKGNAHDATNFSDDELEPFRRAILKPGAAKAMLGWYRAMPKLLRSPPKMESVKAESLLIWGMGDSALGFDDLVPGTEKRVPRLKIHQIPGAGHFVQSEQPAAVNQALIDFMT